MITIGIDPHKSPLTAVAVDPSGRELGQVRLPVNDAALDRLLDWAQPWNERRWAVEGATGLGRESPWRSLPPAKSCWTCRQARRPCPAARLG